MAYQSELKGNDSVLTEFKEIFINQKVNYILPVTQVCCLYIYFNTAIFIQIFVDIFYYIISLSTQWSMSKF